MTEPSPLNDLRSDGIRLETIDLSTVPPERLVAMIADLANRATAENARADRLESERDEARRKADAQAELRNAAEAEGLEHFRRAQESVPAVMAIVEGARQNEAARKAAEARADRLGADLAALQGENDFSCPHCGPVEARADRLGVELAAARAALQPFADLAGFFPRAKPEIMIRGRGADSSITGDLFTVAELRAARAALTSPEGDKP